MVIIGLSGKKQVGKSSSFKFIRSMCPKKVVDEFALAEPLKDSIIAMFGVNPESCYGSDEKKNAQQFTWGIVSKQLREKYRKDENSPLSSRELLQIVGTDLFRNTFSPNLWVELCVRRIAKENPDIAVISDVRFPNELAAVQKAGGIVIRIERDIDIGNSIQHISEVALDNVPRGHFDYFISKEMNETLDDLKRSIADILKKENLL